MSAQGRPNCSCGCDCSYLYVFTVKPPSHFETKELLGKIWMQGEEAFNIFSIFRVDYEAVDRWLSSITVLFFYNSICEMLSCPCITIVCVCVGYTSSILICQCLDSCEAWREFSYIPPFMELPLKNVGYIESEITVEWRDWYESTKKKGYCYFCGTVVKWE